MPLGHRQRKMLAHMALHGGGWPQDWVLLHDDRRLMGSLHRRGLVDAPDRTARLTEAGQRESAR